MENSTDGEIVFVQVPHIRSVQRFVRKRVGHWLDEWKRLHGQSASRVRTFFYVRFEKIGDGHQIFCTVQLIVGDRILRGTSLASGLHRALIRSMSHLTWGFDKVEREVFELRTTTIHPAFRPALRLVR